MDVRDTTTPATMNPSSVDCAQNAAACVKVWEGVHPLLNRRYRNCRMYVWYMPAPALPPPQLPPPPPAESFFS